MNKIEALADAIAYVNGYNEPESEAYKFRNPGMLKAFALNKPQEQNGNGVRVWNSLIGGYRALVDDIEKKCRGKHRAYDANGKRKIQPDSTVVDLLATFGYREPQVTEMFVDFVRRALNVKVDAKTPLSFFTE